MQATAIQSWDAPYTAINRWYIRVFPSLTDLAFLLPALLILSLRQGMSVLLADGDTGWHIRTGEWILRNRTVPAADLFSFTKPHQVWFDWEWGWQVLFAPIHEAWGLAGVAFANVVLLCFISVLSYRLVRRCCGNDVLAFVFSAVAIAGSTIHWLARPHLFSWLFVLVFYHVMLSAAEGKPKRLWWLPVLMLAWVNMHGGFFIGIVMLLTSAMGAGLTGFVYEKQASWRAVYRNARPYLVCAAACTGVSFLNPYTWQLHLHLLNYLRDFRLLDQIQEYQSISFHRGSAMFFEGMLLLGVAAVVWCVQHRKFDAAILMLIWAHLALVSARNIPIFLFIAAPWVACLVRDALTSFDATGWLSRFRAAAIEIYEELQPIERVRRWHLVSVLSVVFLACSVAKGSHRVDTDFDSTIFPVGAIPVMQPMKAARVFTYDQWGDYLIYRLYPSRQVFVDGRGEFYGADFLDHCDRTINAGFNWEAELNRFGVDTVLLKVDAPLAEVLKRSPNWKLILDDGFLIIFRAGPKTEQERTALPQERFSPVSRNGGKKLGASFGLQVDGRDSQSTTHERRSL